MGNGWMDGIARISEKPYLPTYVSRKFKMTGVGGMDGTS